MTSLDARPTDKPSISTREGDVEVVEDDLDFEPRPIIGGAVVGALWAIVMGLVAFGIPILIGWAFAPGPASHPQDALRASAHVWLAAHMVPIHLSSGTIGLLPMGFVAVPVALLALVGRWSARATQPSSPGDAFLLAGGLSVAYGVGAVAVSSWAAGSGMRTSAWAAFLGAGCVALLTTGPVVMHASRQWPVLKHRLPVVVPTIAAGAFAALAVLIGLSAVLAGIAFALRLSEAQTLGSVLQPGIVGGFLLMVLCLGYVPNAVLWASSFAVGPGFAVGTATTVSPSAVDLSQLPAFPLLAALPQPGAAPAPSLLAMAIPPLAGIFCGVLMARRLPTVVAEQVAAWAALAGACAGVMLGILVTLSGGPLGSKHLDIVGPSGWRVGMLAAVSLAVTAAASAWVTSSKFGTRKSLAE